MSMAGHRQKQSAIAAGHDGQAMDSYHVIEGDGCAGENFNTVTDGQAHGGYSHA